MTDIKFPMIQTTKKTGNESLINFKGETIGTVLDFWKWAYSDLLDNAQRGILAEYLVANALNLQNTIRTNWDKYDLITQDGITLEIKTSAYLQTWGQKKLSNLIFGIQPTYGWNKETNEYDTLKSRQADIYIFCISNHTNPLTVNPLDLNQWDFYILNTKILDRKVGNQRSITLNSLKTLGAQYCHFEDLKSTIYNEYKKEAGI